MTHPVGTAYLFNDRCFHAAINNRTERLRRVLTFNYGHVWMKPWQGCETSERLRANVKTRVTRQLPGVGDAYGTSLAGLTDLNEE